MDFSKLCEGARAAIIVFFISITIVSSSGSVNCTRCETGDCQIAFAYDSDNPLRNLCLMEFIGLNEWGFEMLNFNVYDFFDSNDYDYLSDISDTLDLSKLSKQLSGSKVLTLDLYTGAKDCNLGVGMIVGEVELAFEIKKNELIITYIIDEPFVMTQVSSYAGFDILPLDKNGYHTTDPSKFANIYKENDGFTKYTFRHVLNQLDKNFNIIAHAIVFDTSQDAMKPVVEADVMSDPLYKQVLV